MGTKVWIVGFWEPIFIPCTSPFLVPNGWNLCSKYMWEVLGGTPLCHMAVNGSSTPTTKTARKAAVLWPFLPHLKYPSPLPPSTSFYLPSGALSPQTSNPLARIITTWPNLWIAEFSCCIFSVCLVFFSDQSSFPGWFSYSLQPLGLRGPYELL